MRYRTLKTICPESALGFKVHPPISHFPFLLGCFRLSGRRKAALTPVSKRLPPRKLGMAGPRLRLVRWLLSLLDLLSLLFVALFEMLRLLLVALLCLLSPGVICILLSQPLMFLFLSLL